MSVARRWLLRIVLGVLVGAPLVYLAVAFVLGFLSRNADFRSTQGGYTVFVRSNGTHVTLLLPTDSVYSHWRRDFPMSDLRGLAAPLPFIAFGWGDREFMTSTPTWADFNPLTALQAVSGTGQGVMHIEYVLRPTEGQALRIQLTARQFDQLVRYVRASFARDEEGRPVRIDARPYGANDAFYAAVPVYTPVLTCNEWARRGLEAAGVRVPLWSPFDRPILWQLEKIK
jgi:uncharacterized protein (TIGR02117 family)